MNKIAQRLVQREPLVPLIAVEDFQGSMRGVAERAVARSGRVPNQARAMANAGEAGAAFRLFFEDLFAKATLPAGFRFLIRYKVSTMNTCLYCSAHQIKYMAEAGLDGEKIANIHDSDTHPAFDERERVALAFAAAMNDDASNISEDLAERFVATFTPQERVEIALVAGAMAA
jgi:alkylhydroperoxidase family enzyme